MNSLFFLSGIARSGSTLLGSILNQNPVFLVTPTSPLLDLYCLTEESIQKLSSQYTFDASSSSAAIHKSLHTSFYSSTKQKYVFDKHRGWPRNIDTIKSIITPTPKVICTYRHIAENVVSFLKLCNNDPDNFVDKQLMLTGQSISVRNRAMTIWNNFSSDPFYSMLDGLKRNREHIHVVNYHSLVNSPEDELRKIYKFIEVDFYDGHVYNNVSNTCAENDHKWGMKDLHTIRHQLSVTSDDPRLVLGDELYNYFDIINKQLESLI